MITVYGYSPSGNCHKLRMLLGHLGRDYRWIETDSAHGATRTPDYLAKNPNGRVPMIETDDGRRMVESNAILCWLADGTKYFAGDAWQRAQTLSWMFFEQYSHEPYIAVARFICGWTPIDSPRRADLPKLRERGHQALAVMEKHLVANAWFSSGELWHCRHRAVRLHALRRRRRLRPGRVSGRLRLARPRACRAGFHCDAADRQRRTRC